MTDSTTITVPAPEASARPLTAAQREIWVGQRLTDDATAYSTVLVAHARGPVDFDVLLAAMRAAMAESQAVRVRFRVSDGGEVVQEPTDTVPAVDIVDLRGRADAYAQAREWISAELERPYEVTGRPGDGNNGLGEILFRINLIRVEDEYTLAFLSAHHLILDGTAVGFVLASGLSRYERMCRGEVSAGADDSGEQWSLSSLVDLDEDYRNSEQFTRDRDFWLAHVADAPPPPRLLTDLDPIPRRADILAVGLSDNEYDRLYGLARTLGVRTAGLLFAALAGFLHRRTGQSDLMLAMPMAARTTPELRTHLGTFATVLPVRVRLRSGATWRQAAGDIDELLGEVAPHSRFRGEDLGRALREAGTPKALFGVGANVLPLSTRPFSRLGIDATLEILSSGPTGDIDVFFEVDVPAKKIRLNLHGPGTHMAEMTRIADELAEYVRGLINDPEQVIGPRLVAGPGPAATAAQAPAGTLPGAEEWIAAGESESFGDAPQNDAPDAPVIALQTPPGTEAAQVRAILAALVGAHPELSLRAQEWAPGLWEYVPADTPAELTILAAAASPDQAVDELPYTAGGFGATWIPGVRRKPGTLLLAAHPLIVDAHGLQILRRDVDACWAAIASGGAISLAPTPAPADAVTWAGDRAQTGACIEQLDGWLELCRQAPAVEPGDGRSTATAEAVTDPAAATAAGLDPSGAALASLALALHDIGSATGGSEIVIDLDRTGRTGYPEPVGGSAAPFGFAAPLAVPVSADPATALRSARTCLNRQRDNGLDFALLRYLHPQASGVLAGAGERWQVRVRDERGLLRIRGSEPETGALVRVTEAGYEFTVYSPLPAGDRLIEPRQLAAAWAHAAQSVATAAADPANQVGPSPDNIVGVALSDTARTRLRQLAPGTIEAIWALSPLQEGLYFQSVVSEDLDIYNAQFVLEFDRALDPDRLRHALTALMADHPALRGGFTHAGLPGPVQYVVDRLPAPLEIADLRELRGAALDEAYDEVILADRAHKFELAAPPLWRVTLIRRPDGDRLAVSRRFLVWDGWSNGSFIGGLLAHYAGDTDSAPAPIESAVFARYLRWLGDRDRDAAVAAWADYLDGYDEPSVLVPEADPVVRGYTRIHQHTLSAEQSAALPALARDAGVTLNTVLSTALLLVVSRWTGRTDVAIGQTVAGRPPEVEGTDAAIGMFLNTVPVRARLRPEATVADLLTAQQSTALGVLGHDWLSLGEIQAQASAPVLFDTLLVLQNFISDALLGAEHGVVGHTSDDHTHFALTVVITPGDELTVKIETRSDIVDDETADGLSGDLITVLTALAAPGDVFGTPLARLPIAAVEAPQTGRTLDVPDLSVSELLAATAADNADDTALICGDRSLTFGELDAEINRLARLLLAEGAAPETVVALGIERSIEMVVALFAVLRTGAAYLPLELVHPAERLHELVADARPVLALTAGTTADTDRVIFGGTGAAPIDLRSGRIRERLAALSPEPLSDSELGGFASDHADRLDHPAYVIYTSGSTGTPKGVVTGYRGLTNMYVNHLDEIFRPAVARSRFDRLHIAHTVSFAFDMSWEELLWLTYGHTVHVCDEELRRDPRELVAYCDTHRIDVINVTPTYAEYLIAAGLLDGDSFGGPTGAHRPALVLLGGEAVGTGVWDALRDADGTEGYNLYGPTEYTINTLGGGTEDSATPTVGRPISNTVGYLLDPWLRPVPPGVPGELYVEGDGLARGYGGRPDLTAASFVAHPAHPGERLYRTGDLMRRRADGLLDYLGRTDFQIKVRGYRVEPAEVEAVLAAVDGVLHAAVVARTDTTGSTALAGYVVSDGALPPIPQIRRQLAERLPAYMVPSTITEIDEIPVNVNGKRDTSALPEPVAAGGGSGRSGSMLERVLAEIAAGVFGVDEVDPDTNLFDLGAHSLQLMTFADAVRGRLGVELKVADVFTNPTIAGMAAVLGGDSDTGSHLRVPVITFRSGTDAGTPVFILPPGTGLGWRYGQLLAHIPDSCGVFAVQSPAIAGIEVPADLASAAQYFAEQIDLAAPAADDGVKPPVTLLGWSFGGSVTTTVVAALAGRGRPVGSLVLVDAFARSPEEYFDYVDTIAPAAAALAAIDVPVPAELAAGLTVEQAVEVVRGSESVFAGLGADYIESIVESNMWALTVMRELHPPTAPIDTPVLYVEADPPFSFNTWSGMLNMKQHVQTEYSHPQMLNPDAVRTWGPRLADFLER
ncbi:non-ribosomal peptide synthetase [Gordonia amarae]|uniref:Non-ribosomal peptide synthetase n=2 Tax=Gordonia amarae TaxID=36821 RepID=A0A857KHI2_9ACTN|nr:non-ribosomal peptide synthetase [Gordonia amarae]MCS3878258.1 amino acid adenylation domain-containing protein [Gordonia amarae]QHN16918.1 non-ribosomal peptide synthetase [Gordonia amarae]QHN21444.1 non-ribosomal peptide synthetase [Gordonia amarae]QHN30294.1 non-ribosomal peptide synthetase [Gordonia amarae]QHN39071.1 non-ribosomal peptide synthetase [Gordonia amarae]